MSIARSSNHLVLLAWKTRIATARSVWDSVNARNAMQWTKTVDGVCHYLDLTFKGKWATIEDHGYFVICLLHTKPCGFDPLIKRMKSVESAKALAEAWVMEE